MEIADLAPAQAGATIYLMKSNWAEVSDLGEDVAVWLNGYERHTNILRQQVISLTFEVREPTILRTGNLLKQEKIIVRYWPDRSQSDEYQQEMLNQLSDFSRDLKIEAYHLGLKIESQLRSLLN